MVDEGSTLELNVKTTGADTETSDAPFGGLLDTVACAKADGGPVSKRNTGAKTMATIEDRAGRDRLRFIQFPFGQIQSFFLHP